MSWVGFGSLPSANNAFIFNEFGYSVPIGAQAISQSSVDG